VPIAAPFNGFMRELAEMRYLWRTPLRLDNAKLCATLGAEPHTPLDEAVRRTLAVLEVPTGERKTFDRTTPRASASAPETGPR
jgi:hypothetical protein